MGKAGSGLEDNSQPNGKKRKKILILLIGMLVVLVAGGWIAFFSPWHLIDGKSLIGLQSKKEMDSAKPKPEVRMHFYKMDPIIVNLNNTDKMRYLKIKMEIESSEAKANEEYEKRLPQLRDTILAVLTNKNSKDILDSEGKEKLRAEMKEKMNGFLTTFQIQNIYFSEFVIQ